MKSRERVQRARRMEQVISLYLEGCNEVSLEKIMACFTPVLPTSKSGAECDRTHLSMENGGGN